MCVVAVLLEDDSDDDYRYEAVEVVDSDDDVLDGEEDLATATRAAQIGTRGFQGHGTHGVRGGGGEHVRSEGGVTPASEVSYGRGGGGGGGGSVGRGEGPPMLTKRPEMVDDFICNFLNRMGMRKTLEMFQTEWYELESKGMVDRSLIGRVPDVYTQNVELEQERRDLARKVETERKEVLATRATWEKLTQERNHHRMHHRRVEQEKQLLIKQLKQLRKLQTEYEPTLEQLKAKHQAAMQEKDRKGRIIVRLKEKLDRANATIAQLEEAAERTGNAPSGKPSAASTSKGKERGRAKMGGGSLSSSRVSSAGRKRKGKSASGTGYGISGGSGPVTIETNLFKLPETGPVKPEVSEQAGPVGFSSAGVLPAHEDSISCIAMHPSHPVVAAVSDDGKWSLWTLESNELIMSGAGHGAWVGSCAFSPRGSHLATGSGDTTIKLWDVLHYQCTSTLKDHTQAVWGLDFHASGDALVSCSLDGTTRLWDLARSLSVSTLRGHVNSVNSVKFSPQGNALATGSADHTVSLWDPRSSQCVHTFFGHETSVSRVDYARDGNKIASADSDGVVKVWDVRTREALHTVATCSPDVPYAANEVAFDGSGSTLAIGTEDGFVKIFDLVSGGLVDELAHDECVYAVEFDVANKVMVSAGGDAALHVWTF